MYLLICMVATAFHDPVSIQCSVYSVYGLLSSRLSLLWPDTDVVVWLGNAIRHAQLRTSDQPHVHCCD